MTQLTPARFNASQSVRNQWQVSPEYGTPPEALLDSGYWAHVSAKLRRGDIIVALAEDNSYYAELLVLEAGKLFAKVAPLRCVEISVKQMLNVEVPDGYEIKFRGPKKWSVLRGKDVLKEDMDKNTAEQWLKDHIGVAQSKPKVA
jgi:hypothetical protein